MSSRRVQGSWTRLCTQAPSRPLALVETSHPWLVRPRPWLARPHPWLARPRPWLTRSRAWLVRPHPWLVRLLWPYEEIKGQSKGLTVQHNFSKRRRKNGGSGTGRLSNRAGATWDFPLPATVSAPPTIRILKTIGLLLATFSQSEGLTH